MSEEIFGENTNSINSFWNFVTLFLFNFEVKNSKRKTLASTGAPLFPIKRIFENNTKSENYTSMFLNTKRILRNPVETRKALK